MKPTHETKATRAIETPESWDEMVERHNHERSEKVIELTMAAYHLGMARAPMDHKSVPPIAAIHGTVASKHGLPPRDLMNKSRERKFVQPRREAWALARAAGYSLKEIGDYFGGYDHSTVLQGIRAHEARIS